MPEGDTLFRTARVLHQVLGGHRLEAARVGARVHGIDPRALVGRVVERVEARGKNLLISLDDDHLLWSHLRMTGSWHTYPPSEPWQRPAHQASVVLTVQHAVAVGFNLPVLERLTRVQADRHPALASLGPDLLAPEFDLADALQRWRTAPLLPLGEALLDQRLACGVGNVYKAEALFLTGLDPWRTVAEADDEALTALLEKARALMRRNLDGHRRRTRGGAEAERYFVYGREGQPCRRCETPVSMARQGDLGRSTYFCPACQGVRHAGRAVVSAHRARC